MAAAEAAADGAGGAGGAEDEGCGPPLPPGLTCLDARDNRLAARPGEPTAAAAAARVAAAVRAATGLTRLSLAGNPAAADAAFRPRLLRALPALGAALDIPAAPAATPDGD